MYRDMYGKSGVSGGTSARTGRMDVAVLYMRLFIGAVLMLHVIGKLQEYNASVSGFPGRLPAFYTEDAEGGSDHLCCGREDPGRIP